VIAWGIGILLAIVFTAFAAGADSSLADLDADELPVWYIFGSLVAQNAGVILALVWISDRKGQGSLGRDFGLVRPRLGVGPLLGWLAAGAGTALLANGLLIPINALADLDESAQNVARIVENASGIGLAFLAIGTVLIAPVGEELLFRGALLRAFQRRFSVPVAVFASAAAFALVHVIGDPGSYPYVPAWLFLGLVSGYQAAKTGDLTRSVLLHMGFNLIGVIGLVLS